MTSRFLWIVLLCLSLSSAALPAENPQASWYRSPTLAIMTGFIKEPLKPYSIRDWEKGLGDKLDVDRWVADFKAAGADHLIFYDKWIDGFVFHDTKTTAFKTRRDFVRDIAPACRRGGLRLVFYFNAVSDGNPEFDHWAVRDRQGKPIVFSPDWPTRYQTLHSPFRKVAVEQVRELLTGYGPIDGLWLDIFGERLDTSSPWTAKGYEAMYGRPFAQAGATLGEFNDRTLAGYLDEVQQIARQRQPGCVWTSNGSGGMMLGSEPWAHWIGSRLQYASDEGHSFQRNDELARMAWVLPRPTEIGLLLNSTWFTPLEEKAPPASMTPKQAIAATAIAACQGASVYFALTPDHAGRFGEDLQRAKAAGAWFKSVEPALRDAQPYADLGIVLGSPTADSPGVGIGNTLWKRYEAKPSTAWQEAIAVSDQLARCGFFSRLLYDSERGGSWPASLVDYRAMLVPERALLDDAHAERLRQYVRQGGRLIAFGHGSILDAKGQPRKDYALADVLGVHYRGEVAFPAAAHRTLVKTDSEYSPEFAAEHLVDGKPTAWASGGTPMPHWAEITLAEPIDLAGIELVNRQGPYQVVDFDVEARDGKDWRVLRSVRGAGQRVIAAPLGKPVRTARLRVKILKETYEGKDRQYADLEAIRVLDSTGRDRAVNHPTPVSVAFSDGLKSAFEQALVFPPMAVAVEPATAEIVATIEVPGRPPAVFRNRYGKGEAVFVTTSEAGFESSAPFWNGLGKLAIGRPTLVCRGARAEHLRIILTRVGNRHVLHAIDPEGGMSNWSAADVTIALDAARLGSPRKVTRAGDNAPLPAVLEDGRVTFTLHPDPVASVLLE